MVLEHPPRSRLSIFDDHSEGVPTSLETRQQGLFDEFINSAGYAAFQRPYNGLRQFINETCSQEELPKINRFSTPKQLDFDKDPLGCSSQALGNIIGMSVPVFATQSALRGGSKLLMGRLGEGLTAQTLQIASQPLVRSSLSLLESATAGYIFEGVLRPVNRAAGETRFSNGAYGALSFGSWSLFGTAFKGLDSLSFGKSEPWRVNTFGADFKRNLWSGGLAGIVDVEARSKGSASFDDLVTSAGSFALLGATTRALHEIIPYISRKSTIADLVSKDPIRQAEIQSDPQSQKILLDFGDTRISRSKWKSLSGKDLSSILKTEQISNLPSARKTDTRNTSLENGDYPAAQKLSPQDATSVKPEPPSREIDPKNGDKPASIAGELRVTLNDGAVVVIGPDQKVSWTEPAADSKQSTDKSVHSASQQPIKLPLADGSSVIVHSNHKVVFLQTNGDYTLVQDGVRTTKTGRLTTTVKPDGTITQKKILLPDEKDLNVALMSNEQIARDMSNLAHRPFVLDDVRYESIEGLYNCLRIDDPAIRAEVAKLHGLEAKHAGRGYREQTHGQYLGETFELGKERHYQLIKRAIMASMEQNPETAFRFMQTYPRPIIHDTGYKESSTTKYPAVKFTEHLKEVRQELVDKYNSLPIEERDKMFAPKEPKPSQSATSQADMNFKPVSQILLKIKDKSIRQDHNLRAYAKWLESSDMKGTKFLGGGADSVIIGLDNGNLLNLSHRTLAPEMGLRPFDLPILERGSSQVDGKPVSYYIQPRAFPAEPGDMSGFYDLLSKHGYHFCDPGLRQLVRFNNEVRLCDPWAVEKLPE